MASRFFERIGQDWQTVEGTVIVDGLSEIRYGAVMPGDRPGRGRRGGTGCSRCPEGGLTALAEPQQNEPVRRGIPCTVLPIPLHPLLC